VCGPQLTQKQETGRRGSNSPPAGGGRGAQVGGDPVVLHDDDPHKAPENGHLPLLSFMYLPDYPQRKRTAER